MYLQTRSVPKGRLAAMVLLALLGLTFAQKLTSANTMAVATPVVQWFSPSPVPLGNTTFTVNGSSFVSGAIEYLDGVAMPTTFVSATQLKVTSNFTDSGSGNLTVTNPGSPSATSSPRLLEWGQGIKVTILPSTVTVAPGAKQQFTAVVSATTNKTVYWYVNGGSANGTITSSGLYTAPSVAPATPVTIRAVCAINSERQGTATVTVSGSGTPTVSIGISPTSATVQTSATQQFTATVSGSANTSVTWQVNNVTGGSATTGTITSAGLYTAPATIPASAVVVKAVSQANTTKSASATVTVTAPVNPITVSISPLSASLAVGATQQFTATVGGTANTAVTWQVNNTIGGDAANGTISATGLYTAPQTLPVSSITVTAVSQADATKKASASINIIDAQLIAIGRFLDQTTFGATPALIAKVKQVGMQGFLNEQYGLAESPLPDPFTATGSANVDAMFNNALTGQDQLRQRVMYALSEIFVEATFKNYNADMIAPWRKLLSRNALGNYRTLLKELTNDSSMGQFLDSANSGVFGGAANENYPREVMQLFSIGLYKLNQDGSQQLDVNNQPIPTYTQTDVQQLALALTGWTYDNASHTAGNGNYNYYPAPMIPLSSKHNTSQKTLLGQTIPAGLSPQQELDVVIDILFNHPNVGPFMATRMIRAMVTSNPTPGYISRVAAVFNNNGQGVRGDLKAVVNAIIMDPEARNDNVPSNFGRLRTPLQSLLVMCRALNITPGAASQFNYQLYTMGEAILDAPSVFGHYSPMFRIPKGNGLFGPEFQIYTATEAANRGNFMYQFLYVYPINPALQPYVNIAGSPASLISSLDNALLFGRMLPSTRNALFNAVTMQYDNNARVLAAVYLIVTSGEFLVQR
ncbi:MAG TPA: DUF1800 family protein [Blastocatellia bacterium]|nr:DUF1800 family protein [Blastocatellia bacterium]